MTLSVLQLNINSDNYWEQLIYFLKNHDFDVIQLQEITGKDTFIGNVNSTRDVYQELQKLLSEKYNGELAITDRFTSSPESYLANATFYKKECELLEKKIIPLWENTKPFDSSINNFEKLGRSLLHLLLKIEDRKISFINTHGAWGGTTEEKPHQLEQNEKIVKYLKGIDKPFTFTGDLNISPDQPSIQAISKLANNLISEYKITNTLNPKTHAADELFPPGAAVDYIFVSPGVEVGDFKVLEDEDLSDHLALTATLTI